MTYTRNRRDANESAILDALRAVGAAYIQMGTEAGFDLLVLHHYEIYICEIKQPSKGDKLTTKERVTRITANLQGVEYNIITTPEEMLELLGLADNLRDISEPSRKGLK